MPDHKISTTCAPSAARIALERVARELGARRGVVRPELSRMLDAVRKGDFRGLAVNPWLANSVKNNREV